MPWQKQSSGHKVWSLQPLELRGADSVISLKCFTVAPSLPHAALRLPLCAKDAQSITLSHEEHLFGGKDVSTGQYHWRRKVFVSVRAEPSRDGLLFDLVLDKWL